MLNIQAVEWPARVYCAVKARVGPARPSMPRNDLQAIQPNKQRMQRWKTHETLLSEKQR
jgi:hypothetical protein